MPYKTSLFLPFHLADPAGIIFFAHVFTLTHQAFEEWITNDLKQTWNQWFQNPDWIAPIKHAEANYKKPLLAGQPCTIELHIQEIKESSFTLHYNIHQNQNSCCEINITHVFCDRHLQKKIPIPVGALPPHPRQGATAPWTPD